MIAAILRRELRQLWRNRSQGVLPLLFFVLASVCFGLGVPPNSPLLGQFAPAIVWVCSALAILLGGDRAYRDDFRDGVFEQYLVAGVPLSWVCAGKLLADWLALGLPVALSGPLLASAFGLGGEAAWVLLLCLLPGTLVFTALAGFVSAVSLNLSRPGILPPLLMLPFAVPTVVFGAGAVRAAQLGAAAAGPLYFVAALALLSLSLVPLGTAAALRNAMDA